MLNVNHVVLTWMLVIAIKLFFHDMGDHVMTSHCQPFVDEVTHSYNSCPNVSCTNISCPNVSCPNAISPFVIWSYCLFFIFQGSLHAPCLLISVCCEYVRLPLII